MSTADSIYEKARALSQERQADALRYLEQLLAQQANPSHPQSDTESTEWAQSSAARLAEQYGPNDSVYDQD